MIKEKQINIHPILFILFIFYLIVVICSFYFSCLIFYKKLVQKYINIITLSGILTVIYNIFSIIILLYIYLYKDDSNYIIFLLISGLVSLILHICLCLLNYNYDEEIEFINYNYDNNERDDLEEFDNNELEINEKNFKEGELSITLDTSISPIEYYNGRAYN